MYLAAIYLDLSMQLKSEGKMLDYFDLWPNLTTQMYKNPSRKYQSHVKLNSKSFHLLKEHTSDLYILKNIKSL